MATDGETSYAVFIYSDLDRVRTIVSQGSANIGFDAGDERRSDTVLLNGDYDFLETVNVFRIDGKYSYTF